MTKPSYCIHPDIEECVYCHLVNYGLDCHNNPIPQEEDTEPSKYQQVYNHDLLRGYVPSSKTPHLDALHKAGLLDTLTVEQLAKIVIIAQDAYRNGQAAQGAELIDNDAVWLDGLGGLERQKDGTWKLTMPDEGVDVSTAASTLGRKGGQATSPAKTAAARKNAQKGGRPRKYSVLALNRQGAPAPDGFVGTKAEIEDWLSIWSDPENFSLSITWTTDGQEYGHKPLGETKIEWLADS